MVIPIFLACAAFGIDWLVQTDPEKIKAVIYASVKSVEQENPNALEAIISDSYHDSLRNSKKALINSFRARVSEPFVDKIITRIISLDISSPPATATATFTTRVLFDPRSSVYDFKREVLAKVELDFKKETAPAKSGGNWLISRAELLELDLHPANWRDISQSEW